MHHDADAKNLSGLPGEMECVLGGMPLHLSFRNDVGHTALAMAFLRAMEFNFEP